MFLTNTKRFFDLWRRDDSDKFTRILSTFCATQSGPWQAILMKMIADNDLLGLCNFELETPTIDSESQRYYMYARQCLAFYGKDGDMQLCDTELAMWESFQRSEKKNRFMNQEWHKMYQSDVLYDRDDGILLSISRKITDWLGAAPQLVDLDFAFGPGASANVKIRTSPRFKLDAVPTLSENMAEGLVALAAGDLPHYWDVHARSGHVVPGQLSSVVKNAKTKRSILIEPTLATPYQKAIGKELRKLLKVAGCDLSSQKRNQELALYGSLTGAIVTVDVKNASNSVFLLLVYHLITNEEWFDLLNCFRTSEYKYKGQIRKLEMFSSMGNGFTFELESLIFYAIAMVVCERCKADTRLVSVYGDDIIVPIECYAKLVEVLDLCGFEVNSEKTHSTNFFRESCGKDYSYGQNVRPWYKRDRWTNARVVGLLNFDLRNNNLFYELRPLLLEILPHELRVFGPDGYGDGHLITDGLSPPVPAGYRTPQLSKRQFEKLGERPGYYFETFVQIPKKDYERLSKGDTLLPLYNIYAKPSLRRSIRRRKLISKYHITGKIILGHRVERLEFVDDLGGIPGENNASGPSIKHLDTERLSWNDDPYVLRGGSGVRKIRVYCWSLEDVPTS